MCIEEMNISTRALRSVRNLRFVSLGLLAPRVFIPWNDLKASG